jgi:hypothetical protein
MTTTPSLLDRIANSALGRKFQDEIDREAAEARVADRQSHAVALAALEREHDKNFARLNAACQKTAAAVMATEIKLGGERALAASAYRDRLAFTQRNTGLQEAHRAALRASASPLITAEGQAYDTLLTALRAGGFSTDRQQGWTPSGQTRDIVTGSNYNAVNRRMDAVRAAMIALDELAASPIADADVPQALEKIRSTIPGGLDPFTPCEPYAEARVSEAA